MKRRRRSKYLSLGIIDALFQLAHGFSPHSPERSSREILYNRVVNTYGDMGRSEFSKRLYSLEINGHIVRRKNGDFRLTNAGQTRAIDIALSHIVLKNKKQDGYQRIIVFDIPERQRRARDAIRLKLKEFECIQLQRSVYITPYVCEKEIRAIATLLKIDHCIHILKIMPS
mgnify:CR=1 FL=1